MRRLRHHRGMPESKRPTKRPIAALAAVVLLAGCGLLPRASTVPLRVLSDNASCSSRPETLLVMLPGAASLPEEFLREGFVLALRERRLALDVALVDAHLGYYKDRTILERLQADVIAPARAKGYRKVWLVGVSLGGLGALIQARAQPADADGLMLLAPYLGERRVTDAVRADGGLKAWRGAVPEPVPDDVDLRLWQWLQAYATDPTQRPPLLLGYALGDRLAPANQLLAASLPADRVFTTTGGHDWPEWRLLWNRMLERAPFIVDPTCTGPIARGK
jgi:pimeloyl-ACP methyl ester carboxylesterase